MEAGKPYYSFPPESWLHVTSGIRVRVKDVCQTLQPITGKSRVVGGLSWDLVQVGLLGRTLRNSTWEWGRRLCLLSLGETGL